MLLTAQSPSALFQTFSSKAIPNVDTCTNFSNTSTTGSWLDWLWWGSRAVIDVMLCVRERGLHFPFITDTRRCCGHRGKGKVL